MSLNAVFQEELMKNKTCWGFKGNVDYVDEWFLMKTPVPLLLITLGYLLFVLKLGPDYMKSKSAANLKSIVALYNVIQIGVSCYICYIGIKIMWPYGFVQSSCVMEDKENRYHVTSMIYIYFIAKVSELLDTIFFVLRKNYRQITLLHVYHHAVMLWNTWVTLKFEPSYDVIFVGTLNSFVHLVMYTYYFFSTFPELNKYLWWKKYITKLQIVQFLMFILHTSLNFFYSECPPSYLFMGNVMFNAVLFLGLFVKFYLNSYKKSKTV